MITYKIYKRYPVHDLNPNCSSRNPNLTIIFFHGIAYGINDEWKETWTTRSINGREKCICWPQMWLPEDLNDYVRILSLSYDSNVVASVHNDVTEIGKNLVQSLVINSSYQMLWDKPVAIVTYSFGGLVFKSLVVEAHKHVYQRPMNDFDLKTQKYCEFFLNNLKGVVFYGVPHAGGSINLSKYFKWQCQQIAKDKTQSCILKNMKSFNPKMEQLSVDFTTAIGKDLNIYAFGEGLPINNKWGILVPMASAFRLSGNNNYIVEDANHLTICKPPTKEHPSYSILLEHLKTFMKKQNTRPMPPLPCHGVALEDKANVINCLFQKESIVALIGMGGIGKTTLSKKVYHLFHDQYDKSSFLEDVKSKDINNVKKQLLHDLCDKALCKDEDLNTEDLDRIKQCMISKKVLVVVDDVGETKILEALLQLLTNKDVTNVDYKSKILVNCRNLQILKNHVKESANLDMPLLEEEQAKELFMFHAFKHANHVTNDIKKISMEIIKACEGLPLSLEVLGSYLCDISILEVWKAALHTLKNGKNITGGSKDEVLWTTLRISYDHLDTDHQNMFLDIACFLVGFNKSTLRRVYWNGDDSYSPMLILQNLKDRSLIKWAEDGGLYMHEQLQDMGRNIAMEVTMSRFIWKPNVYLQNNQASVMENLEGISLKNCEDLPSLFQNGSKEFHNLRLLDLTKASPTMVENFIQSRNLDNLRWLCLQECMIQKLPSNLFKCSRLQVLHLTKCNHLHNVFDFLINNFNSSINVDMKTLPIAISLQELILSGCSRLQELPTSIGQFNALQELNLSWCSSLQELPTSIGQLNALQKLDLEGCLNLQELPTSIGQLNALQNLNLKGCSNLQELPTSIGQLNALQNLDFWGCSSLQKLPTSIGQLNALQNLSLGGCSKLQELPTFIGQLNALQKLHLGWCSNLQKLPTSIGQLNALQSLDLWCQNLQELPTSIGQLNALQNLSLAVCKKLQELPTSIGQLNALRELNLCGCSKLQELPTSIGQLNALQDLNLSWCTKLQELPTSIGQLNALQNLHLRGCSNLQKLPTYIGQLNALQNLDLEWCSNLQELPTSIGQLNALQNLDLEWCSNLQELPTSIGQLNALQNLNLKGCSNLQKLPTSIGQLNALQNLNLKGCSNLQELPTSIGQLNALQNLNLKRCSNLQKLPTSIGQLNALQNLNLKGCSNLQELPTSIGQLNALQELDLVGCSRLQKLPISIGQLHALQNLDLQGCSSLRELPTSIGQLNALQNLDLWDCTNL
ncbi:hypothetical protein BDL97_01G012400 [Sphagnum fallax]|nr:hypothetical protein BDL97_01G012400 [Sphagnum fallax]